MIKKILVLTLFLCAFLLTASRVFAQEATDSAQPNVSTSTEIQYDLPYPGILPDNPLYDFKTLRDKIVGFLIIDPLKKSQFYLLNSDKRVRAGMMLFDEKKYDLGVTTVSKSNNYMHDAVTTLDSLSKSRKDLGNQQQTTLTSIKKHEEVIQDMIDTSPTRYHRALKVEIQRLNEFKNMLKQTIS